MYRFYIIFAVQKKMSLDDNLLDVNTEKEPLTGTKPASERSYLKGEQPTK